MVGESLGLRILLAKSEKWGKLMRKRSHFSRLVGNTPRTSDFWWGVIPTKNDFANRILKPGDASFIQPECLVPLRTQRVVAVCPEAMCSGETEPVPTCPAVRRRAAALAAARIFSAAFSSRS